MLDNCLLDRTVLGIVGHLAFLPVPVFMTTQIISWTNSAPCLFHKLVFKTCTIKPMTHTSVLNIDSMLGPLSDRESHSYCNSLSGLLACFQS